MVTSELAAYLAAQGLGTVGTDIFRGFMPNDPDACIALIEYPGEPNEVTLGTRTVALEHPRVQVLARGVKDDHDGPRLVLQNVVAATTMIGDTDLSGVRYLAVEALQAPFQLRIDDNFRRVFAVNLRICKYFSTT